MADVAGGHDAHRDPEPGGPPAREGDDGASPHLRVSEGERLRRWRLVLGGAAEDSALGRGAPLSADDRRIDAALAAVYDASPSRGRGGGRGGALGRSAPSVARWLGDIRRYFPTPVVQVLQRDAVDRLDLRQLLLEPELLGMLEPDLHLVTLLVELHHLLPDATRATARKVVADVLARLEEELADRTRQAVTGALARSERSRRPRPADIDWSRTIGANLRHWLPEQRTVVPERLVGYGRRQRSLAKDVIVAIDQSASMADSVVYAALFGAVLARLPALRTHLVAFDTAVVDLSAVAADPVDVLFGVQLGGGTDIGAALRYCRSLVTRPADTVLLLISDLHDGGPPGVMGGAVAEMVRAGMGVVCLLALSDDGATGYDHRAAAELGRLGAAVFAATPDVFPEVLGAALDGRDVSRWAADRGLVTAAAAPRAG